MANFNLTASTRDVAVKNADLRASGKGNKAQIPAVVYGHSFGNTPITLDYSEFLKTFREAGTSNIITLKMDGKEEDVLVQEVQVHPVSGAYIHVDFHVIIATEAITTKVPLVLEGRSGAEKEGALIDQSMQELEIKCLPKDLISEIKVDITALEKVGDIIHVDDLGLDTEKYEITVPGETPVVSAHALRAQEAEEPAVVEGEEGEEGGAEGEEGGADEGGESAEGGSEEEKSE